jgi:hypothetical protein
MRRPSIRKVAPMQTEPTRPQGLLAKFKARLRGDRYMVNAYPAVAVEPEPAAAPVKTVPVPPTTPAG